MVVAIASSLPPTLLPERLRTAKLNTDIALSAEQKIPCPVEGMSVRKARNETHDRGSESLTPPSRAAPKPATETPPTPPPAPLEPVVHPPPPAAPAPSAPPENAGEVVALASDEAVTVDVPMVDVVDVAHPIGADTPAGDEDVVEVTLGGSTAEPALEDMSVKQLRSVAAARDISLTGASTKKAIIARLKKN